MSKSLPIKPSNLPVALLGVIASLAFLSPAHAATLERASFTYFLLKTLDTAIFWLQLLPAIFNLALVITSLYLMLDGIRRWGNNKSGAFSRTLIGLFILHSSSCSVPFLPYLALFLEIWLCARGLEARTSARLAAEKQSGRHTRKVSTREKTNRGPQSFTEVVARHETHR